MDVWKEVSHVGEPVMFRVPPGEQTSWVDKLAKHGLETIVAIPDVQE